MILLLDVGNSRVKWRLQDDGRAAASGAFPAGAAGAAGAAGKERLYPDLPGFPDAVGAEAVGTKAVGADAARPKSVSPKAAGAEAVELDAVWVASVAGPEREQAMREEAQARWGLTPWFARAARAALGVTNSYAEPERLGADRWLAMLAAWRDCGRALCVADAGSALTIDFVDAAGAHRGGYILPGLESMRRALLQDTRQVHLELEDALQSDLAPGRSTAAAAAAGLLAAQIGALASALNRCPPDCALYFTGGGGQRLQTALAESGAYRKGDARLKASAAPKASAVPKGGVSPKASTSPKGGISPKDGTSPKDGVSLIGAYRPDLVLDGLALLGAESAPAQSP